MYSRLKSVSYTQDGEKWQRRRPRWLAITRVNAGLLQRTAQCSYRPWASTAKTAVALRDIPGTYKARSCDPAT